MNKRPLIRVDENIPYIRCRLEKDADVIYADQSDFSPESIKETDALIVRTRTNCNRDLLDNSPVKIVATATIGTDHIDTEYCGRHGIKVENSPGCNAPGVAQYVWSSLLRLGFMPGREKLGIIGCGNVGSIVAEWGLLMGCDIMVSDPPKAELVAATGESWLPSGKGKPGKIREASLEDILRECDAVTLHTPLTREGAYPTKHLIGPEELAEMKPGAILVNAARGPVVDNRALKAELKKGSIKAVIDTWEGEPALDKELLESVTIATPHIAGYSRQGKERATRMVIETMERFFGIEGDTSGLTGAYQLPDKITADEIVRSYDPFADDSDLRKNPDNFEKLRHDYAYREEV